jgi:uncharacterized oligopeptide transporter (OPT) family protein
MHDHLFSQIREIYGVDYPSCDKWVKLVNTGKSGARLFKVGSCIAKTLTKGEYTVLLHVLVPALISHGTPIGLVVPPIALMRYQRTWVMLMPDIFKEPPVNVFDLKGSMRKSELSFTSQFPHGITPALDITDACKFLMSIGIMDYSLIIGIGANGKFIGAGIVDILQTYTTRKRLERAFKTVSRTTGISVCSPAKYADRLVKFTINHVQLAPILLFTI